jgi:hypothetical protein
MLVATQAVHAYPNLNATTGIVAVPTANIVGQGAFIGAADVLFFDDTLVNARVVYGLSASSELGASLILGDDTAFGATGKFQLPGDIAGFTPAIGGSIITGSDIDDGFQVFIAGTRALAVDADAVPSAQWTLGANFTDIEDRSAFRPFIGAELFLGGNTSVASEFVLETGDFDDSIFSLVVRHDFPGNWSGEIGITNAAGLAQVEDHEFFAGVSFGL